MPIYHMSVAGAAKTMANPLEERYLATAQIIAVHQEADAANPMSAKDRESPIIALVLQGPMSAEHEKVVVDLWYRLRRGPP